jgi:NADPH2:quinone reductase
MRTLELQSLTGPDGFALAERPEPAPSPETVLLDVFAAGVSFPDLLVSRGRYQLRPELPWIAGGEVAGVVRDAPPGHALAPGDRAWSFLPQQGGFAEVVAVPANQVHRLPDALSFAEGAALGVNFLTAVFALRRRTQLRGGETIVVLGAAGGLGSAIVSVAKAFGAEVIAVVSREEKRSTAANAGADAVIVGRDWRQQAIDLTGGRGADLVADVVGGEETLEAVRATAAEGRVLILGFASGEVASIAMNRPLLRNISIVGAGLGALTESVPDLIGELAQVLEGLIDSGLRPIVSRTLPLEQGADAVRILEEREAEGKIVIAFR